MCIMTIISATNKQKYLFELMNQIMRIMHIYFRVFPLCSVSFRDTKCAASGQPCSPESLYYFS